MFLPLTIVLTLTSREAVTVSLAADIGSVRRDRRVRPAATPSLHRVPPARPDVGGRPRDAVRSALAGHGDRRHADRARLEQRLGAGRERRAGRDDVVDEDDPAAPERSARRGRVASPAAGSRRNAPATFVARSRRSRSNWAIVARARSRMGRIGRPSARPRRRGDQLRLVVAAATRPLGVDRHRDEQVAAGAGTLPASRDGLAERDGEPGLAAVLQLVQRPPDDARRTARTTRAGAAAAARPTAARSGSRPASSSRASSAGRQSAQIGGPSAPQPGTAGRKREVERATHGTRCR